MIPRGQATVVHRLADLRALADEVRARGGTVGYLGTSGNLHVGHLTLIRRMVAECDLAVMPLIDEAVQPVAGLLDIDAPAGYLRDGNADRKLALEAGIDLMFQPDMAELYPQMPVRVHVVPDDALCAPWPNAEDPGFIRMTATAVAKMWNMVGPCRYYAGEKDWVPLTVLRRIVDDLSFPVELVACPIVREHDGVCASSRNARLTPADRAAAPVLHAALCEAAALVEAGERSAGTLRAHLRARIEPVAPVDYAEVVDARTLASVDSMEGELRLLVSARFGDVHLFDNVGVSV